MWRKLTSTLLVAAVVGLAAGASYAAPYNTKRIDDIPDFTQYDPALGLPNGGKYHCAVVAAANALVWLADRKGFKRLLPVRGVTVMDRVSSVVQSLSSEKYMATDPGFGEPGGTQTHRFLSGLERYLDDAGGEHLSVGERIGEGSEVGRGVAGGGLPEAESEIAGAHGAPNRPVAHGTGLGHRHRRRPLETEDRIDDAVVADAAG
ncbi:MAG: hypothetical protein AAFW88_08505, partial [Pseudomonadota bacterium]